MNCFSTKGKSVKISKNKSYNQENIKSPSKSGKVNGYSNRVKIAKKERKRKEAEARNRAWNKMSFKQQLEILNGRPGNSARQATRILAQQSKGKKQQEKIVSVSISKKKKQFKSKKILKSKAKKNN